MIGQNVLTKTMIKLLILMTAFIPSDTNKVESPKANRLIKATSPYLLQHAYNPVDWFEWGKEALEKAKKEDKPILVSIGYSSCHWCHVMERESFEDHDIAAIMNEHFVCIKIDREERPDIDQIYMDAVQTMGQNGGWPLNVFLTPDQKPFYGGTYFPPKNWSQLLIQISKAYREKKSEINSSAEKLSEHLAASNLSEYTKNRDTRFQQQNLAEMFEKLSSRYDQKWGGLDKAPKFVMPSIWQYLLRYYVLSKNDEAKEMVIHTLKKMAKGGMYDLAGGGFARYSVDKEWFVPHFEKMLYDNAQLMSLYSEAYRSTKDEVFKEIVYQTAEWLDREMRSDAGAYYSALDADSEGMEGKYYVWTKPELDHILGTEAAQAMEYYSVSENGNWESNNILTQSLSDKEFIEKNNLNKEDFNEWKRKINSTLINERKNRIPPGLDDKILTGWNAMMIVGFLDAYIAFDDDQFLNKATKAMKFIETNLMEEQKLFRSYKGKHSQVGAFLEDYAFLIQAYINLYQCTFEEGYLEKANLWAAFVMENFYDQQEGYFHFTSNQAENLIARKKEIFDNVIPSSNAVMARNLIQLGTIMDNDEMKNIASEMILKLGPIIKSEPAYMSYWGIAYAEMVSGYAEIVIVGKGASAIKHEISLNYLPFSIFMGAEKSSSLPLLKDKSSPKGKVTIFVCYNKTCKLPVQTAAEALKQIKHFTR